MVKLLILSLALAGTASHGMNAPGTCELVDVLGGQVCIYSFGNAFNNWITTEDGKTLCRHTENGKDVYTYAVGQGDASGLECSNIPLSTLPLRPIENIPSRIIPIPAVSPEEQELGEEYSLVNEIRSARREGRQLQQGVRKLKNLVIMIRWADEAGIAGLPTKEVYQAIMSSPNGHPVHAPSGSVNDVLNANLYGKYEVEHTVVGWINSRFSHEQAAGSPRSDGRSCGGTCDSGNPQLRTAILEALNEIDGKEVNIGDFDLDNNGQIDLFTVIHSGFGAEGVGGRGVGERWVWSHKWALPVTYTSKQGGVRIRSYNVNPGRWGSSGVQPSRIGVIAHESFHFLGLPDLYDTDSSSRGISQYGLMANSWGVDGSQRYPPSLSAWSKYELGVIKPMVISGNGVYELQFVQDAAGTDKSVALLEMRDGNVKHPDYILIEYRQKTGFDSLLDGGILIWHIDPTKRSNSEEGYPGSPNWPSAHYRVRLIQADGLFELEKNGRANAGDWFYQGNGPSVISDTTVPSIAGYTFLGNPNRCSGHSLTDFSPRGGSTMSFRYVRLLQDCSGKPDLAPTSSPTISPSVAPTKAPTSKEIPWNTVCQPRFYNARDGCDCGCGTVVDPDCSAGGFQSNYVFCNGSTRTTPGATCDLITNKCVQAQANTVSGVGLSKEEMESETEADDESPGSFTAETSMVIGGVFAGVALVGLASFVFVRRKRSAQKQIAARHQMPQEFPQAVAVSNPKFSSYL